MSTKLNKLNVLIVGGGGFIGAPLTVALSKTKKYNITVLENWSGGYNEKVEKVSTAVVTGDVSNSYIASSTYTAVNPDIIIYLAAFGVPPGYVGNIHLAGEQFRGVTNILNCIEIASKKPLKFIYGSTSDIYDGGSKPVSEDGKAVLTSTYAILARAAENLIKLSAASHGYAPINLRFAEIYGKRTFKPSRLDYIVYLIGSCLATPPEPFAIDDVNADRDFMHVDDAVSCIEALVGAMEANGDYNIGSGTKTTFKQVYDKIRSKHKQIPPMTSYKRNKNLFVSPAVLDITRIVKECGVKITHNLMDDIEELMKYYQNHPLV